MLHDFAPAIVIGDRDKLGSGGRTISLLVAFARALEAANKLVVVDDQGRRTLTPTNNSAPNVAETGHIPWEWIEHINPKGDEYDGSAIFFVRHRAPGHGPYDYITYREGHPEPFGPNKRDYYAPLPDLGTTRPQFFREWWRFVKLRL